MESLGAYYSIGSPGTIAAFLGSVANSVYKDHDAKLAGLRAAENILVLGLPVDFLVSMVLDRGTPLYYLVAAGGVFLLWNNPMVRPWVNQVDSLGVGLLRAAKVY
jgi:hypothetical protein